MNHPVTHYKNKSVKLFKDLLALRHDYNNLERKNQRLENLHSTVVTESVALENALDIFIESIEKFCNACARKGSTDCRYCPLYPAAVTCTFWEEEKEE